MPASKYSSKNLFQLLKKKKVATIAELKKALDTTSTMTVFRKLRELNYVSSCTHSGKYYTLERIARFDAQGLWRWKSVVFSAHGTLRDTVQTLVEQSMQGYTATELVKLLELRPNAVLAELVSTNKVTRVKISRVFVYFSKNNIARKRQELARKDCVQQLDVAKMRPTAMAPELKAALIIFFSMLNEQQRRLYAGLESLQRGYGGDKEIADLLNLDPRTVAKGRKELLTESVDDDSMRKEGGGRKEIKKNTTGSQQN
jgi:hypothetical protein